MESEKNSSILRQPWSHNLIGNVIWERYVKSDDFNPFLLSPDFQKLYAHFILKALEPKAWKCVLGIFLHMILKHNISYSLWPRSINKFLERALDSLQIEVPELNVLLNEFTRDVFQESFSAITNNNYSQVFFNRFFYLVFLFHILKSDIKCVSQGIAKREAQKVRDFEKVFELFISKIGLIRETGHLEIFFSLL
ncbi:hypothetical protein BY996DRAFT_7534085 [Phakopsora pachyrhizi]|nr:hypothetical protein BY996DRAFT_7534085 [Phakopsora pachyrhizi]